MLFIVDFPATELILCGRTQHAPYSGASLGVGGLASTNPHLGFFWSF